jgi:hypothetical protein
MLRQVRRGGLSPSCYAPLEVVGLYWSFLDGLCSDCPIWHRGDSGGIVFILFMRLKGRPSLK